MARTPINAPLTTRPVALDHAVGNLVAAFDICSLVPVPAGTKPGDVPTATVTETDSPNYLRRLVSNNVAVTLGGHSGLVAIKFSTRLGRDEFLAQNAGCHTTLITNHVDGAIIWLRATTAFRAPLVLPQLSIQMTGNLMVYDRSTLQCRDEFLNFAEIQTVDLSAINWGPDSDSKIAAWGAILAHGEFFRRGGRGQKIANAATWRAYFAARLKSTTCYESQERRFYSRIGGSDWHSMPIGLLRDKLRALVNTAPVGMPEAKSRITDEWLNRQCERLKASLATQLQVIEDRLRFYMEQRLIEEPGANLTNAELFADFDAHCIQTGQPSLSPTKFRLLVGRMLRREPWRVGYSKSIPRPSGQQNGWRGLRIKSRTYTAMTTHGAVGALGA